MTDLHEDFILRIRERLPLWRQGIATTGQSDVFEQSVGAMAASAVYDRELSTLDNWQRFADTMMKKAAVLYGFGFDFDAQLSSRLYSSEERVFAMTWAPEVYMRHKNILWFVELEKQDAELWREAEMVATFDSAVAIVRFFKDDDPETAGLLIRSWGLLKTYMFAEPGTPLHEESGKLLTEVQAVHLSRLEEIRSFVAGCMTGMDPQWKVGEPPRRASRTSVVASVLHDLEPMAYRAMMAVYDGSYGDGDVLPDGHEAKIEWLQTIRSFKSALKAGGDEIEIILEGDGDHGAPDRQADMASLKLQIARLREAGIAVEAAAPRIDEAFRG